MLRVLTQEDSCEFMKIGINDYTKIIEVILNEKNIEFEILCNFERKSKLKNMMKN
jgi:hypothetical protein